MARSEEAAHEPEPAYMPASAPEPVLGPPSSLPMLLAPMLAPVLLAPVPPVYISASHRAARAAMVSESLRCVMSRD